MEIRTNPRICGLYTFFKEQIDYNFSGEVHDFYELVCVLEGAVAVAADSNVFVLKKGQAILHPPMQFHSICNEENRNAVVVVFTFSGENIPGLENGICNFQDVEWVNRLYEEADRYYVRKGIWIEEIREGTTEHFHFVKGLEMFLMKLVRDSEKGVSKPSVSAANYSMIVRTMEEHMGERLTVGKLAQLCSMSEIGLQKTFSKYSGMGVMEYFRKLQIRKASELLKEGCNVKETALKLGYTDQNYFSTVFKRIMGKSPREYKV